MCVVLCTVSAETCCGAERNVKSPLCESAFCSNGSDVRERVKWRDPRK